MTPGPAPIRQASMPDPAGSERVSGHSSGAW
jgi:hypothetical protein